MVVSKESAFRFRSVCVRVSVGPMARPSGHLYLSPHFDDAVLSCGGTIRRQSRAGERVRVITIFGGAPEQGEVSPLARSFHAVWGAPSDAVAARREENRGALEILGADEHALAFRDAIYRGGPVGWFYETRDAVFGPMHEADRSMIEGIVDALGGVIREDHGSVVHAPLGIGNHVDHRIVHAAAIELWKRGWPVLFYEDFPYARKIVVGREHKLPAALLGVDVRWHFRLQSFADEDLAAKIDSVRAYATQLRMLFHDEVTMVQRVREYSRRVGAGGWAERFWVAQ